MKNKETTTGLLFTEYQSELSLFELSTSSPISFSAALVMFHPMLNTVEARQTNNTKAKTFTMIHSPFIRKDVIFEKKVRARDWALLKYQLMRFRMNSHTVTTMNIPHSNINGIQLLMSPIFPSPPFRAE